MPETEMPENPPTLLLTRPRAQAERLAAEARARIGPGLAVVIAPVLEIVPTGGPVPLAGIGGVILTSENAVAALAGHPGAAGLPAWCVGDRTAAAAKAAGLAARSAGGDVEDLVALLLAERPEGRLLHLSGAEVRGDPAARLAAAGLAAERRVVYTQEPRPLGPEARALLAGPGRVVAPLFSPRSAALLAEEAAGATAPLELVAMSAAVAEAWAGAWRGGQARMRLAARPEAGAMLEEIAAAFGGLSGPDSPC